jgi:rRNA maturation RNase YbeY
MAADVNDSTGSGAAARLRQAADCLLVLIGREDAELSVMLVDDARMRELNSQWRRKDRPTDVLSFPQFDEDEDDRELSALGFASGEPQGRNTPVTGRLRKRGGPAAAGEPALALGDVVVSVDTARAQAQQGGWTLEEELNRLLLHGVLHLLGYDHERGGEEERRMQREELRLADAWAAAGHPCARGDT